MKTSEILAIAALAALGLGGLSFIVKHTSLGSLLIYIGMILMAVGALLRTSDSYESESVVNYPKSNKECNCGDVGKGTGNVACGPRNNAGTGLMGKCSFKSCTPPMGGSPVMFGKCVGDTSVAAAEGLGNGGGGASTCPNTQCFAPLCSESGSQGGEALCYNKGKWGDACPGMKCPGGGTCCCKEC